MNYLEARGRTGQKVGNRVDGARFESYDPVTKLVSLRVDDSQVLEFWLQISFNMKDLEKFIHDAEDLKK
jgi:hypothetical protein